MLRQAVLAGDRLRRGRADPAGSPVLT